MAISKAALKKAADEIDSKPNKSNAKKIDDIVTGENMKPTLTRKPFKKPNSDYYRLDMIVRGVADGKQTEEIKTNYKEYLSTMAAVEGVSMTKYIQALFDKDMGERKELYEATKKLKQQAQK